MNVHNHLPLHMPEVLARHSASTPHKSAYVFLPRGAGPGLTLSYQDLERRSARLAAALASAAGPGEPVLLIFPPGLDFIVAFFAVLKAGAIAVPLHFAHQSHHQRRLSAVLADCGSRLVLTNATMLEHVHCAVCPPSAAGGIEVWDIDQVTVDATATRPSIRPDDLAVIQYTSGSTGTPKGVMVSHANLMANEAAMQRMCGLGSDAVCGGWLPHYHDMGLVGNLLHPLFVGGTYVFMPPLAFVQRPSRWLRMISDFGIESSAAPNFAYDLCSERCRDDELDGVDLSRWHIALNGAEPVRAHSLRRFAERFARYGFEAESFRPCYGMAETTLLLSGQQTRAKPQLLAADKQTLEQQRQLRDAEPGPARTLLVGCGEVAAEHEVLIVDPETGREAEAGDIGEIWARGPSVARGYWRNPAASEAVFGARTADGRGPYLRTGDLGVLHHGRVYVTGRLKDIIIVRGRTLHPQDIEHTVNTASPQLGLNTAAVFATDDGHRETVVAVQEMPRHWDGELGALRRAIVEAVARDHDITLADVRFIPRNALPRTTSGKLQRAYCRFLYLQGQLTPYIQETVTDAR